MSQTLVQEESTVLSLSGLKAASRWLGNYAKSVYSQAGEDGVLAKALSVLPARDRWCVEFGAWDGKHLSNTYNLVEGQDYRVVLVEGDATKFQQLQSEYPFRERAFFKNCLVGWTARDGLDAILGEYPIPRDFDLVSIDVDGNDYHIWKAMEGYRPKLVLIEINETASNRSQFVQPADPGLNVGSSPDALVRLGKEKGYELISVTKTNLLFVDAQYYGLFAIPDNSLEVMRDDEDATSVYVGMDGSVHLDGPARLVWHGVPLHMAQPLPGILRHYPPTYNLLQRILFRLYRILTYRGAATT